MVPLEFFIDIFLPAAL